MVAMVHVHTTTALTNNQYTALLNVLPPSTDAVSVVNNLVRTLSTACRELNDQYPCIAQVCHDGDISKSIRSLPLLLLGGEKKVADAVQAFAQLPFVDRLVQRAVSEVDIFVRNGITHVEVENIGAPYFVGQGGCPIEELVIELLVCKAIRARYPTLSIGLHVLSSNELEALPIAICHGVAFIRSESTVFAGMRPEGQTTNSGNLARFMYVRNWLRSIVGLSPTGADLPPIYPQVWSDLVKKHTVFPTELLNLETWLHNITFIKLEGVIITGPETGSNVKEKDLVAARDALEKAKAFNEKTFPNGGKIPLPDLPLVTGSGTDFPMYCKYADYMIIGTALKQGGYWENEVSEEAVKKVMAQVSEANEAVHS